MGSFSDGLKKSVEKAKQNINDTILAVIVDTFNQAVVYSPTQPFAKFAKGQFINSWYPAVNGIDSSVTSSFNYSGSDSYSRISTLLGSNAFLGKDAYVTLANSLSYANLVEYKGWNRQGPYAPCRATIAYFYRTYTK